MSGHWEVHHDIHTYHEDTEDPIPIKLMLLYDDVNHVWSWKEYGRPLPEPWNDMKNVRGLKEARATAIAQWRMQ